MAVIVICEYVRSLSTFQNKSLLNGHFFFQKNYSCIKLTKKIAFLKLFKILNKSNYTRRTIFKLEDRYNNDYETAVCDGDLQPWENHEVGNKEKAAL